jgi:DNA repair exonuclease SbcCD ATPase subunit
VTFEGDAVNIWNPIARFLAAFPTAGALKLKLDDAKEKIAQLEEDKKHLAKRVHDLNAEKQDLSAQIAQLKNEAAEIAAAASDAAAIAAADNEARRLTPEEEAILVYLSAHPGAHEHQVTAASGLSVTKFKYHWHRLIATFRLVEKRHQLTHLRRYGGSSEPRFDLTQGGRVFLVRRGLVTS